MSGAFSPMVSDRGSKMRKASRQILRSLRYLPASILQGSGDTSATVRCLRESVAHYFHCHHSTQVLLSTLTQMRERCQRMCINEAAVPARALPGGPEVIT
eukprot:COSAG02_NODE_6684_length_3421_cov_1.721252_2_plen_100_part_00